jgi:hypothetical protein
MRFLLLVVGLLIGCATHFPEDKGLGDVATPISNDPVRLMGEDRWSERDEAALNRSISIGRSVTERLKISTRK